MPDLDELNKSRLSRKWGVLARRLTADTRILPKFIIIGAQKAGTTSLYHYLVQHPQVLSALKKEIYFFTEKHHRGLRWYRSHFPSQKERDALSVNLGLPVVTGESTPYYIYHPLAIKRIHQHLPDAKLIALLRNPVDRAYSHYHHSVKRGEEPLPSFEAAINAEENRLAGEVDRIINEPGYESFSHKFQSYLAPGRYIEQLREVEKYFPRRQLLILSSEAFYADPQSVCNRVSHFLGLEPASIPDLKVLNATPKSEISPEQRLRLQEYFAPYNQALYAHLDHDFGW